jgi:hypothetical protein
VISLSNDGSRAVAFRIRVSVPNVFIVKTSEGVLEPTQKLDVPVVLKTFPSELPTDDSPLAKFALEFLECDDEYYLSGAKAYWASHGANAVRKSVLSKAIAAVKTIPLDECIGVSPSSLSFKGKCI